MTFDHVTALTFDCYGTLIDWEAGILAAIRAVLGPRGIARSDDELLGTFAEVESPIQQETFQRYRTVLDRTMAALSHRFGFEPTPAECRSLADSVPTWEPFPDTVTALRRLAERFDLGIISNVDDDLFAGSAARLGVPFAWVVTAEQVGSYKPARTNFHRALERIGRPWNEVVHCAQSLYHDVGPARSLGLATVWVDRRRGRIGGGATPPSAARPDLTVPDLATLAALALR
ncbi:MAG: haloacid dehalogenase type II [Gemmatimonadales bacterium]